MLLACGRDWVVRHRGHGSRCTANVTTGLSANAWYGREPTVQARLAVGSSNWCCPLKVMSWNRRSSLLQRRSHWRTMHFLCSPYECDSTRLAAYFRLLGNCAERFYASPALVVEAHTSHTVGSRRVANIPCWSGRTTIRPLSGLKRSSTTIASTSMTCRQAARTEVTPTPFENCWSCIDSNGARGTAMPYPERMPYPRKGYAFVCGMDSERNLS